MTTAAAAEVHATSSVTSEEREKIDKCRIQLVYSKYYRWHELE